MRSVCSYKCAWPNIKIINIIIRYALGQTVAAKHDIQWVVDMVLPARTTAVIATHSIHYPVHTTYQQLVSVYYTVIIAVLWLSLLQVSMPAVTIVSLTTPIHFHGNHSSRYTGTVGGMVTAGRYLAREVSGVKLGGRQGLNRVGDLLHKKLYLVEDVLVLGGVQRILQERE